MKKYKNMILKALSQRERERERESCVVWLKGMSQL